MILNSVNEESIVCFHDPPVEDEWLAYTHYIGELLGRRIHYHTPRSAEDGNVVESAVRIEDGLTRPRTDRQGRAGQSPNGQLADPDLVILSEPRPTWPQRLLRRGPTAQVVNRARSSVLIVRGAHRPLRQILLVVRDHKSDEAALSWAERLAVTSRATVTMLPVIPAYPRLYRRGTTFQPPLSVFADSSNGHDSWLDRYTERLKALGIAGTMRLRQGTPVEQIHREVHAGMHDLIVIAAESPSHWERLFLGELVGPLLNWVDRPVLVAR